MIDFNPKTDSKTTTTPLSPIEGKGTSSLSANNSQQSAGNQRLTALLNLLKQLPEGKVLEAQIKSSQLLSQSEKSLLEQANPSLVKELKQQIAKNPDLSANHLQQKSGPSTLGNTSGTGNGSNSLQNTNLFLAKLLVNQPNGQSQLITTVTPQAFKINESVIIGLRNQQLVIDRSNSQKAQHALSDTIKHILPKQQSTHVLQQFIQHLSQLPKATQSQLLTRATMMALQQLNHFTHSNQTLHNGQATKKAISDSGIQLEAKLSAKQSIGSDFRALLSHISNRILGGKNSSASMPPPTQTNTSLSMADAKSSLNPKELEKAIVNLLQASANNTGSPSVSSPLQQMPSQTATTALMRLLGMPVPPETPGLLALPKIIEQHLKQLIEKTQARIQLNQLRSLSLDKALGDNRTSPIQQFHTELPLRFNEQVLPVQISIQEQEYKRSDDQEDSTEKKDSEKTNTEKRWQVFMSFDLPDNETLHTRVNIIDTTVSATLWAESNSLCNKANQKISFLRDKLLANGLIVDDLVCIHGKPPQQDLSLDYNLVDIKT